MHTREGTWSDFDGRQITKIDDWVTVVVRDHPDLPDRSVVFDAALDELAGIAEEQTVRIELWFPDGTVMPLNVTAEFLAKMSTKKPMADLLTDSRSLSSRADGSGRKYGKVWLGLERMAFRSLAKKGQVTLVVPPRGPR